ncbi:nullo family protein [Megaselia abdita]
MGCVQSGCDLLFYYEKAETAENYYKRIHMRLKKLRNYRRSVKTNDFVRNLPELARCSSFRVECCTHCLHFHFLQCCMKPCETISEAMGYAEWKINFEQKRTKRVRKTKVKGISDALAGQFTPKGFPGFTDKNFINNGHFVKKMKVKESKVVKLLVKWNLMRPSYNNRLANMMEQEILDLESYYGFH